MKRRLKAPRYDPTKNTSSLVKGSAQYQNGLRRELDKRLKLTAKYIHRLKTQEFRMQDAARVAESKRIDEQLLLRDQHDRRMGDMILSRSEANDTTFAARLDRLEQFMFTQAGKGAGLSQFWGVIVAAGGIIIGAAALFVKFG